MAQEMSVALIEALMDRAWPALDREVAGGWVMRAAGGVTQRANSVWLREEAGDNESAVRDATQWYRSRRLPLIFQVFDDERSAGLNTVLDAQRFTRQSETLIMVHPGGTRPAAVPGYPATDVEISEEPSDEWLGLWWSVDGRGGDAELDIARKILTSCPSVYALMRDDDGARPPSGASPSWTAREASTAWQQGLAIAAGASDGRCLTPSLRLAGTEACRNSGYW